jgi:hypothetical protein
VKSWLHTNRIPQQIFSIWFNRQPNGGFNLDTLRTRSLYNVNDSEYIQAISSKRGENRLTDTGLKLIDLSYIVLYDLYNIRTYEEVYDANKVKKRDRERRGYIANCKTYIFRLRFDESEVSRFFEYYWAFPDESNVLDKMRAFDDAKFPLDLVSVNMSTVEASQSRNAILRLVRTKSKEEFFSEMIAQVAGMTFYSLGYQQHEAQVKAMISDIKPIQAKIGLKEDVRFEKRFFVYENVMTKSGEIKPERRGVVKAYRISDNRQASIGDTPSSSFYQIGGKKLDSEGMYIVERNYYGLNLYTGFNIGAKEGIHVRLEYYLSRHLGRLVRPGRSGKLLTSVKMYGELGYKKEFAYKHNVFSFGLQKDFYPSRNWHLGPYVGINTESIIWENYPSQTVNFLALEYGISLGLNLRHNIQLMTSLKYFSQIGEATLSDSEGRSLGTYYGPLLYDRLGYGASLGLRMMF